MANDEISARVRIDGTQQAVKDLQSVGKEGKKLDGESFEAKAEVETKGAKTDIKDFIKLLEDVDGETATAALAIKAAGIQGEIKEALTQLSTYDGTEAEARLLLKGVAEMKGDLDQVESKIKEVNGVEVSPKVDTSSFTRVKDETESTRSSVSSMANSVGNNASEMGAALGLGGPIGQSIGEFGEYMSEARLEGEGFGSILSNFGKFAGPIAALSVGVQLVTSALEGIQKRNEAIAKASTAIAEGIADDFETIKDSMGDLETGDFADRLTQNFLKTQDTVGRTILALKDLGINVDDLGDKLIGLDSGDAGRLQTLRNIITESGRFKGATAELTAGLAQAVLESEDFDAVLITMKDRFGQTGVDFVNTNKDMIKALEQLDDAGEDISIDQIIDKTKDALLNAAGGVDAFIQATSEMPDGSEIDILSRAYEILGENQQKTAAQAEAAAAAQRAVQTSLDLSAASTERYNQRLEEERALHEGVADAAQKQADAMNGVVDAATAAADSQLAANDAFAHFGEVLGDNEASADDVRDAAIDLAKATAQVADDQLAASGKVQTTTGHLDAQNAALLNTAAAAKGPARQGILDYIGSVNQIPPEKMTDIQAAIDRGDLAEAQRLLDEASKTRTAAVNADANTAVAKGELDALAKNRTATVTANVTVNGVTSIGGGKYRLPGGLIVQKHGGTTPEGGGIAGEAGAEFIELPTGERMLLTRATYVPPKTKVTSAARTRSILHQHHVKLPRFANGTGGGSTPITMPSLTINAAVIGNRFDVARAVHRAQRDLARISGTRR